VLGHRAGVSRRKKSHEEVSKPCVSVAYAYQRLTLGADGKAHHRKAKTSNRTWGIRPSGMIGALGKRGHGGIVNPPRNRKGERGNPSAYGRRIRVLSQPSAGVAVAQHLECISRFQTTTPDAPGCQGPPRR